MHVLGHLRRSSCEPRHAANPEPFLLTSSTISGCMTNKYAANGNVIHPPVTK